jgi:hypothetical protein
MIVNFYDGSGLMLGADAHKGADEMLHLYAVAVPSFQYWTHISWKRAANVTSHGWFMLLDGCDWYLVPHVPVPPNDVLAWPTVPMIIADSGSKAFMSVHSVTSKGDALATTFFYCIGYNANCWEFGLSMPTGYVLQLNSVKTSPTLGDYIGAVVGLAVDNIIGAVVEKGVGKALKDKDKPQSVVKHIIRRFPDLAKALGIDGDTVNWFIDTPGEVKKAVQESIDSGD